MRRAIIMLTSFLMTVSCTNRGSKAEKEEWIQLFNGKDLDGWIIKIKGSPLNVNYKNTFRVEDSILKVSYEEYEKFAGEYGHIYYKTPFSHYKLRVEYRFVGEQVPGENRGPSETMASCSTASHPKVFSLNRTTLYLLRHNCWEVTDFLNAPQ